MSFGSDLRAERSSRGIPLATIAAATRIPERHLLSLEADAHSELPGGVFNKGFLRNYCRHLGLDENHWVDRYTHEFADAASETGWAEFAENVRRNRAEQPPTGMRWWGVALMLAVLAALSWVAWHYVVGRTPGSNDRSRQAGIGPPPGAVRHR